MALNQDIRKNMMTSRYLIKSESFFLDYSFWTNTIPTTFCTTVFWTKSFTLIFYAICTECFDSGSNALIFYRLFTLMFVQ